MGRKNMSQDRQTADGSKKTGTQISAHELKKIRGGRTAPRLETNMMHGEGALPFASKSFFER